MLMLGFVVERHIHFVAEVDNKAENVYKKRFISSIVPFRMTIFEPGGVHEMRDL